MPLQNGDFESGVLTPWFQLGFGATKIVTNPVHSGGFALRMEGPQNDSGSLAIRQEGLDVVLPAEFKAYVYVEQFPGPSCIHPFINTTIYNAAGQGLEAGFYAATLTGNGAGFLAWLNEYRGMGGQFFTGSYIELRLEIREDGASLYINGAKIGDFTGVQIGTLKAVNFSVSCFGKIYLDDLSLVSIGAPPGPPPPNGGIDYYVCTYANPRNGSFQIGGTQAGDGGRIQVVPGQLYNIVANPLLGYNFANWGTARAVTVADPTSPSTTVTFDASGWDGVCLGNLTANYIQTPSDYSIKFHVQNQALSPISSATVQVS